MTAARERLEAAIDTTGPVYAGEHLALVLAEVERARDVHLCRENLPKPMEVTPDWKPRKRIVDRNAGRDKLRVEAWCRCGCDRPATDRAHLVPRDLGGDDVDDNLIPLAHVCHMRVEHREPGWRDVAGGVRAGLLPVENRYALDHKGRDWLDRYWPAWTDA